MGTGRTRGQRTWNDGLEGIMEGDEALTNAFSCLVDDRTRRSDCGDTWCLFQLLRHGG